MYIQIFYNIKKYILKGKIFSACVTFLSVNLIIQDRKYISHPHRKCEFKSRFLDSVDKYLANIYAFSLALFCNLQELPSSVESANFNPHQLCMTLAFFSSPQTYASNYGVTRDALSSSPFLPPEIVTMHKPGQLCIAPDRRQ